MYWHCNVQQPQRRSSKSNPSNSASSTSTGSMFSLDTFFMSVEHSFEKVRNGLKVYFLSRSYFLHRKVLSQVDAAAVVAARFINENLDTLPDQQTHITKSLVAPPSDHATVSTSSSSGNLVPLGRSLCFKLLIQ